MPHQVVAKALNHQSAIVEDVKRQAQQVFRNLKTQIQPKTPNPLSQVDFHSFALRQSLTTRLAFDGYATI